MAAKSSEQLGEAQQKNLEMAMRLAQMSIENSQRIMELQTETARQLFDESMRNARAISTAKDPEAALSLRSQYAQASAQLMIESARKIADIANTAQSEFARVVGENVSGGSKDLLDSIQNLFSLGGVSGTALSAIQSALDNARSAFDQISQASGSAISTLASTAQNLVSGRDVPVESPAPQAEAKPKAAPKPKAAAKPAEAAPAAKPAAKAKPKATPAPAPAEAPKKSTRSKKAE